MKTIFNAILIIAMLFIGNVTMNAQNGLIRNTEEVDGLIVSETIFKMEAQRVFIVVSGEVVVFATGIQLTVHQLPVVFLLLLVPVHGTAAAHVLHLNGAVQKAGHRDDLAVTLAGLVNGVGEDLKDGVFAAL